MQEGWNFMLDMSSELLAWRHLSRGPGLCTKEESPPWTPMGLNADCEALWGSFPKVLPLYEWGISFLLDHSTPVFSKGPSHDHLCAGVPGNPGCCGQHRRD